MQRSAYEITSQSSISSSRSIYWVCRAESEAKMAQPYALVCEAMKTAKGFSIQFIVDERVMSVQEAKNFLSTVRPNPSTVFCSAQNEQM
jgi:hypothetical protein